MKEQFSYRPDIQVIRAMAVILVIGYHLGLPGFAGGFLGVDVFFVVSGFLMQKLYRPEDGPLHFWKRRAARLLPAYFLVVLATLLTGAVVLLPDAFARLSNQVILASLFLSNFGFWSEESYFTGIYFSPLLHLWSLAVEAQYYLVVPLLALLFRRHRVGFVLLVIGSFLFCLFVLTVSPKTSFFMMPLRFWEFGMGMLVASLRADKAALPSWASPLAMAGLVGLLFVPFDGAYPYVLTGHPSLGALGACVLTSVMLAGQLDDRFTSSGLGRACVRIGDMSYSLYLVHFPLLALSSYVPFEGTRLGGGSPAEIAVRSLSILVAAYVLHRFVERPGAAFVTWPRVAVIGSGSVVAALVLVPLQLASLNAHERNLFASAQDRGVYRCGKLIRITHPNESFCLLNSAQPATEVVLLVGDSHSDAIKESFAAAAAIGGVAVGFPVSNEVLRDPSLGVGWLIEEARRLGARRVFLHHSPKGLTADEDAAAIDALMQAGLSVAFILPVPIAEESVPRLLFEADAEGKAPPSLDRADYAKAVAPWRTMLRSRPEVAVIDLEPVACAERCPLAAEDGRPYYFDHNHLTLTGARRFEGLFAAALADGSEVVSSVR